MLKKFLSPWVTFWNDIAEKLGDGAAIVTAVIIGLVLCLAPWSGVAAFAIATWLIGLMVKTDDDGGEGA